MSTKIKTTSVGRILSCFNHFSELNKIDVISLTKEAVCTLNNGATPVCLWAIEYCRSIYVNDSIYL